MKATFKIVTAVNLSLPKPCTEKFLILSTIATWPLHIREFIWETDVLKPLSESKSKNFSSSSTLY